MSLKFAVVGSLLNALGTPARAEGQTQNLEPVGYEPIPTIFRRLEQCGGAGETQAAQPLDVNKSYATSHVFDRD